MAIEDDTERSEHSADTPLATPSCSAYGEKHGKASLIKAIENAIYESQKYMECVSVEEMGDCYIFVTEDGNFHISAHGQDVEIDGAWTLTPLEMAESLTSVMQGEDIVGALENVIYQVKRISKQNSN